MFAIQGQDGGIHILQRSFKHCILLPIAALTVCLELDCCINVNEARIRELFSYSRMYVHPDAGSWSEQPLPPISYVLIKKPLYTSRVVSWFRRQTEKYHRPYRNPPSLNTL
jgi:hypothetical protein